MAVRLAADTDDLYSSAATSIAFSWQSDDSADSIWVGFLFPVQEDLLCLPIGFDSLHVGQYSVIPSAFPTKTNTALAGLIF
jgi:hypothetical protein